jgi:diguanylate cyclase (GGDEF)-like protein
MACATFYALGYAFELASSHLGPMLAWNKVQYIGISFIPFFWILLCARYSGRDRWLRRPVLAILFALSLATLLFNASNSLHHLFYRSVGINVSSPFPVIVLEKGIWYWVHIAYANIVLLIGNLFLVLVWRKSPRPYRLQSAVLVAGSVIPWIGFCVYIIGLSPYGLDTTPLAMTLAGPILAWGLFRYRILDLVPVAHDSVFASMRDGTIVLDIRNRIVDFNPAAAKILPRLSSMSIGLTIEDAVGKRPELESLLQAESCDEASIRVDEGDALRFYQARLSPITNRRRAPIGRVLVLSDATEQVLLMRRLQDLATTDELTGAYNRRHFLEVGKAEIARAWRYGHPISIIILDVDHFKRVNDTWGHEAGDHVLREACRVLKSALRSVDILGRHGGEEFAILLLETPPAQAVGVAERLRALVAEQRMKVAGDAEVSLTVSIGLAGATRGSEEDIDLLIRRADAAMYKAKEAGRNCVRVAEPDA